MAHLPLLAQFKKKENNTCIPWFSLSSVVYLHLRKVAVMADTAAPTVSEGARDIAGADDEVFIDEATVRPRCYPPNGLSGLCVSCPISLADLRFHLGR